jgi:anti-sigma factor RsiW
MCNKEVLVGYIYDELPGPDRMAFEEHLASCAACGEEVQALRRTRVRLASWAPAEPDLRFEIVRSAGRSSPRWRIAPGWGLAAAAVLVVAVASAIANLEVRVGAEGLVVRTGWSAGPAPADPAALRVSATDVVSRQDFAAMQRQVRDLETALAQSAVVPAVGPSNGAPLNEADLYRRVRQMILESESRQDQQFAARLVSGLREIQAAHTLDLVRLEQTLNKTQGAWSDEVFRQREEMKHVYRLVNQQR